MKTPQIPAVLALTLLPWLAVWIGLYQIRNAVGTFALYHGLCLLPAIIAWRSCWKQQLAIPSTRSLIAFLVASLLFPVAAAAVSHLSGDLVVSKQFLLNSLHGRGYSDDMLVPISLYLIFVNGPLEEFFWRGIILKLGSELSQRAQLTYEVWTAVSFASWHFLVLNTLLNPGWALPTTILFTFVGLFLGWLMKSSRSLLLVSLWHGIVFDGAVIAVFLEVLGRPG